MTYNCTSLQEKIVPKLFIEASAGTGKTFVIENYVVRAVLDASSEGKELDPKTFAIITFTKAVARELRLRVQRALERAKSFFLGEPISGDIPEYFSLYTDKKQAVRALSFFLDQLRSATITTIHGFCEKILAYDASGEELGGWEHNQKKWLEEFLQEEKDISVEEWNALAKNDLYDNNYFIDRVLELMEDSGIDKTLSREECFERLEQALEPVKDRFKEHLSKTSLILGEYAKQFRGNCTKEGSLHTEKQEFFEAIERLIHVPSENALKSFFRLKCNLPLLFEEPLKGYSPLQGEEYFYFQALVETVWPCVKTLIDPESIRRRVAKKAAKAFFEYAARTGKKTFEILLRRVLSLTKKESFCSEVRKAFSWVIIDEFQDTDTTQLDLFTRIFLQENWKGNILFVGDPKQAIYAFRKADVYSYMRARDLLKEHVRSLFMNHRASHSMVEALNVLFAGPEHPFVFFLPKEERHLVVTPSLSAGRVEDFLSEGRGALHFIKVRDSLGRKRNWPHEAAEKKLLCFVHDELISLERQGVPFKQQAILVKDRYQAKRVEEFLSGKNIPTCGWRLDLVTESPICFWLKKVFSLLAQPRNKRKLLSLLFSMEGEEEACRQMALEQNLTRLALAFIHWERVQKAFLFGGIGAMARELFDCCYNGQDALSSYLARQERSQTTDLEQLLEVLSLVEERLPRDVKAFLDVLGSLEEYFAEDREILVRRVDPDDEGVPILTMHRSKGLEFDVVYALATSSRTPQTEGDLEEVDAEKLRQAYVALTRAKKRVYLPLFLEEEGKKVARGQASPVELLMASLSVGKKSSLDFWADSLYMSMNLSIQEETLSLLAKEHPRAITSSCVTAAEPSLFYEISHKKVQEEEVPSLTGSWRAISSFSSEKRVGGLSFHPRKKERGGALLGTHFHEAVASLLLKDEDSLFSKENILSRFHDEKLASLLFAALQVSLPLRQGEVPLGQIPRTAIRCEVPFLFQHEQYKAGVIDLLFQYDGFLYVVDWKTQEVDMPLREYILEEQYDLQASLYQNAVRNAFPHVPWGGFFFVFVSNLLSHKEAVIRWDQ